LEKSSDDFVQDFSQTQFLKMQKDGWWEGILGDPSGNGRAGLFPHNYVEVLPN